MRTKKLNNTIAMLKDYKERNELTYEELSEQTNFSVVTLNKWLTGRAIPMDASIEAVQNFLNAVYSRQFVEIAEVDKTYIDSRLVAQLMGSAHKDLLEDIRGYIKNLEKQAKTTGRSFPPCNEAREINVFKPEYYFIKSSYTHPLTKLKQPCYLVTQRGCEMIAHKKKGLKGTIFTALYIDEFHRMKENEQAKAIDRKPAPRLEDDPTFSREAIERRLANMTQEQRDLNYIRNRLIEVSKTDDIDTIIPDLVRISKMINLIRGTNDEIRNL